MFTEERPQPLRTGAGGAAGDGAGGSRRSGVAAELFTVVSVVLGGRWVSWPGKTLIRVITSSKLVPFSAHHFTLKSMLF